MNEQTQNTINAFVKTLREMFMIDDAAELDFGIYRIMAQKKAEIEAFFGLNDEPDENALCREIEALLAEQQGASVNVAEIKRRLNDRIRVYREDGETMEQINKKKSIIELRQQLEETGDPTVMLPHILTALNDFFSRYYDKGDFISQRRYVNGGDATYLVPYNGEEVKLHWANADQYYIKTSEAFKNYRFKLKNGKEVEFTLKNCTPLAINNIKDLKDYTRMFKLWDGRINKDDDILLTYTPIHLDEDGVLRIDFSYELQKKKGRDPQGDLNKEAFSTLIPLIQKDFSKDYLQLLLKDEDKGVEELLRQIRRYTAKNKRDFFIHKNLGDFLRRELDFYLKNEIMHVSDLDYNNLRRTLAEAKTIKAVGEEIIQMLAALEDFQKKLWLKKKFVVLSDYCITLDRVPESLYEEICTNEEQHEEWKRLFDIESIKATEGDMFSSGTQGYTGELTVQFLKENPHLVLDTAFFNNGFKHRLLESMENIDAQCDGLLVNSENFQALELLQEKQTESISGIFIDPPYNTGDDGFVYKDNYCDSSWLTMINDRLRLSTELMSNRASTMISIGDEENEYLASLIRQNYGKDNFFGTMVGEKKKKGSFLSGKFARMKDYIHCYAKNIDEFGGYVGEFNSDTETYPCVNPDNGISTRIFKAGIKCKYKLSNITMRAGEVISAGNMSLKLLSDLVIKDHVLIQDVTVEGNWRYTQDCLNEFMNDGAIYITQDLYFRRLVTEERQKIPKDLLLRLGDASTEDTDFRKYDVTNVNRFGWGTNEDANEELHQIIGEQYSVSYPKPSKLITLLLALNRISDGAFLDYFAGSGTTAHAVINLNREDGGKRKYILCEMGEYFNTIIIPRIKKVIYSKDWKNGKPVSREGSSHCFKYIRLEQYEDTLNNLYRTPMEGAWYEEKLGADTIGYVMDMQSQHNWMHTDWMANPFGVKMQITHGNEMTEQTIDVVETFNYLLGLNVEKMLWPTEGMQVVTGTTRRGKRTMIIWRNTAHVTDDEVKTFLCSVDHKPFKQIYINGETTLGTILDGKLRQTETEFEYRMFPNE